MEPARKRPRVAGKEERQSRKNEFIVRKSLSDDDTADPELQTKGNIVSTIKI